ncbi:SAM-dependent methyltransferase [Longimonas halophila]|uniref:SAM-dependent methyltransferase n=1 Tax=Longimonas halophila TaxID=1469170 RepID=A0A2H3P6Y8_9BACT|nr:class I SAM-dependent methyltransferase [Longimonas halophila]PEN08318.1 SAM-dependent methyltransferase [Longimonas halophila]
MSLRQLIFAKGLRRIDAMQHAVYAAHKTRLLGGLRGTVVEIGPGTGLNLAYLNRDVTYVGLEPNRHLHARIRAQMRTHGIGGRVLANPVEAEALPPQCADVVISTLVLCSVPNVAAALASIRRLLRPGGRFVFIEHIAAEDHSWPRLVQDRITPLWHRCLDGCHPNRATDRAIRQAGFQEVAMTHFSVGVPVIRPHCAGYAVA